jgi:hypothetical protein
MSRIQALKNARRVLTKDIRIQRQGPASIASVVGGQQQQQQQVSSAKSRMVTYSASQETTTDYYANSNFSLEATLNQVLESQRLTSQVVSDPSFENAVKSLLKT